ncbi:MAG: hypothetical protein KAW14_14285, partial [Candidatus Aegiribacteria sp.]|nr:hypothetical protein [Candidatus Aegiribacteria sp.]
MSLDAISKIEVLCHAQTREKVLEKIESSGKVHLIDLSEIEQSGEMKFLKHAELSTDNLSEKISSLEKAIQFLEEETAGEKKQKPSIPPSLSEKELMALFEDEELLDKARKAWLIAIRTAKLEGAEKELEQERDFLIEWKELPVPFEDLRKKGSYLLAAGVLEKDSIQQLHSRKWATDNPLFYLEVIQKKKKLERVIAVFHKSVSKEVLQTLGEAGFTQQDFGSRQGMVKDNLEEVCREMELVEDKMKSLHEEAVKLSAFVTRFRILLDAAGLLLERLNATRTAYVSTHVFMFRAWIRTADLDRLKENLAKLGEVAVEEIEPEKDETPPSPITETVVASPYTLLTDMYGQPTRSDPDPTPLIAPFYALFFGICIGDA